MSHLSISLSSSLLVRSFPFSLPQIDPPTASTHRRSRAKEDSFSDIIDGTLEREFTESEQIEDERKKLLQP
ncbi:hypothetical protein AAC387_Pa10g2103 [Persea americana]